MDNLWVLIVLLCVGGTIVTVRLFLNGAREEESAALEAPAPVATAAAVPRAARPLRTPAAAPAAEPVRTTASRSAASPKQAPPPTTGAVWPGGDCPGCGTPTVPSAKFCGECGHCLTA